MFSATDVDKNGYIDYVEFVAVMLESSSVAQWVSVLTYLLLLVLCWRALLWHSESLFCCAALDSACSYLSVM